MFSRNGSQMYRTIGQTNYCYGHCFRCCKWLLILVLRETAEKPYYNFQVDTAFVYYVGFNLMINY